MKKIIVLTAMILCLFMVSCTSVITPQESPVNDTPEQLPTESPTLAPTETPQASETPPPFAIALTDLPEDYSYKEAVANGDCVYTLSGYINEDKMTSFLDAASQNKNAAIRKTSYTDEGDPIISDIVFDGSKFTVWYDTTRDQY